MAHFLTAAKVELTVITILFILILKEASAGNFMSFVRHPSECVPIPSDLTLCEDVGYSTMVLPNLLNHESLDEARQQSHSFVPLLREHCHPHLQIFLCSLFAPVCLPPGSVVPGPLRPCRSLCQSVERYCTPIMKFNSFDWPPMLNCSQFTEEEPCVKIPSNSSTPVDPTPSPGVLIEDTTNICAPCGRPLEDVSLHDNYCASEFVLKIKIKRVKSRQSKGIREITADRRKRVVYKSGSLTRRDLKKLKLVVTGSKKCKCSSLDSPKKKKKGKKNKNFYLVMGRKSNRKLLVTVIHTWSKRNKILKKASKRRFGAELCPSIESTELF